MDNDASQLNCRLQQPMHRRAWLLWKALECFPLDRALDLARMAEQFVGGSEIAMEDPISPHLTLNSPHPQSVAEAAACDVPSTQKPTELGKSKLLLAPEQRQRLLNRLATGARNMELADEFGISPRQVQGIRISQARIAKLSRTQEARSPQNPPGSIEEVVRFLRQQDDVVVRQDGGEFLVNGRFRLGIAELVERANRIRARQGKPRLSQSGF